MRIKRSYSDFKSIVEDRKLQIFEGDLRSDYYHLLAIDGQITYEAQVLKNGEADQLNYESTLAGSVTNRISENPDWDDMQTTNPSTSSDLHTYKKNGVIVQTVLITYKNSSKAEILRMQKTRV
jgi:hypothetical protein